MSEHKVYSITTGKPIELPANLDRLATSQELVDSVFSEMSTMLSGQSDFLHEENYDRVLMTLNSSDSFKQLVADVLMAFDVDEETINPLATFFGHFVFAGYCIRQAEISTSKLDKLIQQ